MAKTKIALLYERLSRDDELQGESFQSKIKSYYVKGGVTT